MQHGSRHLSKRRKPTSTEVVTIEAAEAYNKVAAIAKEFHKELIPGFDPGSKAKLASQELAWPA